MMDRRASQSPELGKAMGVLAFTWRLILTTGTGSIFGFLVAREAYDAAIMAPLFISASFLYGLAFTVIVLLVASRLSRLDLLPQDIVEKFGGLLMIFAFATLYFTAAQHLTKLYASGHQASEAFILRDGGIYTLAFWIGQIVIGTLVPLAILYLGRSGASGRTALTFASILFLIGGLAQMYVIIIGGQAYPLKLFPGMDASSSFFDGAIALYRPSLPEALLGVGGIAIAMLITALALRLLPFLPQAEPKQS
jgi:molybdopterin-containing oxidoreductase family membrane subunit